MKYIGALSTATFFFSLCMHLPHQVCLLHFSIVENTKHGIRIMLKKKRPTKSARPLFTILRHERNLKDKRTQSFRISIFNKVAWFKSYYFSEKQNFGKLREASASAARATDRSDNNNFAKNSWNGSSENHLWRTDWTDVKKVKDWSSIFATWSEIQVVEF